MFSELKRPAFIVGVIVAVILLRALENFVPAVRVVTNPGMKAAA